MMEMQSIEICSECGAPLPSTVGEYPCAVCLIEDALGGESIALERGPLGNIGGFELMELIARGGMGIVYRARQNKPLRDVALKALSGADLLEGEARERFRIELDATASLEHPAILPVYESGEEDGIPFFTMKLATGGTLAGRIGTYSGKWQEIAHLIIWVAEAVYFAHQRGIIHRDIKPGNILFDETGKAYVSDFGLAKVLSHQSDLTRSIAVLGTPHYLAPEVAAKNSAAASTASDIWALGAVLYELLAGHTPFVADSVPSLLRSIVEDEPQFLPPEVPRPLRIITLKTLCKDPSRRYASAACLAEDLRRWLRGDAILARPTLAIERLWIKSRKSPRLVLVGLVALISLCCAVWLEIHRRSESTKSIAIEKSMREESRGRLLDQARAGRKEKHAGWRESGLAALRKAAAIRPDLELRDEAIAHLAGYDLQEYPSESEFPISFGIRMWDAASGREVITNGGGITVRQRSDGRVIGEFPDLDLLDRVPIYLGSGGRIVLIMKSLNHVLLLDAESSSIVGSWENAIGLDFMKGGDFAFLRTFHTAGPTDEEKLINISALSLRDGTRFPPMTMEKWSGTTFSDVLDQPFFAIGYAQSLEIWNWRIGERVLSFPLAAPIEKLDWTGGRLVYLDKSGRVALLDTFRKSFINVPSGAKKVIEQAVTEDGSVLLLRDESDLISAVQTDSRETLVEMPSTNSDSLLVLQSTPPEVYIMGSDKDRSHYLARPEIVRSLSFTSLGMPQGGRAHYSPDGRWLLLCSKKELRIVDHAAGTVLLTMPLEDAFCAFFSLDCKHLIVCEKRRISLHELFVEDRWLEVRHIRDLKQVANGFSSYPSLSYNRRWLSVPETLERMLVLDCEDFETWHSFPADGYANVTWTTGDGRWLVAGSRSSAGLRLWDRTAGSEARVLREGNSSPKFSPDDRWLVEKDLDNAHLTIYDTTDWKPVFKTPPIDEELPGSIDWSPDGRILAISMASNKVRLVEAGTWRTLANLDGSAEDAGQALFSPCGGHLLETSDPLIEIWDLTAMSRKLARMGLPVPIPSPVALQPPPREFAEPLLPIERPLWFTGPEGK